MSVFITGAGNPPKIYDEHTLLLLHGDDISDSSMYGRSVINHNVTLNTSTKKFGASSLYFNGSSAYLETDGSPYQFGTGDFTFDFWFYPISQTNDNFFFNGNNNNDIFIGRQSGNGTLGLGRVAIAWDTITTNVPTPNTWSHIALVRNNGIVKFFINGSQKFSTSNNLSYDVTSTLASIGMQSNTYWLAGYLDEYRISNIARWTSDFTPPNKPY